MMSQYKIVPGTWQELKPYAEVIRRAVFIEGQNIAESDEWDDLDNISLHFIVFEANKAIATARLLQNDSVGRVAVLEEFRGLGVGKLLMLEIIVQAKQQQRTKLQLSAQQHAISFYENLGFKAEGDFYLDCGIPHINMTLLF